MTKLELIKQEIQTDPTSRGYAGKTPAHQAILMNQPIPNGGVLVRSLTSKEIIDAIGSQKIAAIEDSAAAAAGPSNPGHENSVRMEYYLSAVGSVEVATGTQGRATLDGLVTNGVLVAQDVTNLVTIATTPILKSRSDALQIGSISQGEVEQALK